MSNINSDLHTYSDKRSALRGLGRFAGESALAKAEEILMQIRTDGKDKWAFTGKRIMEVQEENTSVKPVKPAAAPLFASLVLQQVAAYQPPVSVPVVLPVVEVKEKKAVSEKSEPRECRHNINRPGADTICGHIWATLDKFPNTAAKDLKTLMVLHGWEKATVTRQFYEWRKFNGITGRAIKA